MQAFNNARHFHVENLLAVDNTQYQIYPSYINNDEWAVAMLDRLGKAACLAAGHQSAERFDPPKCHPETRIAVINDIMSWVNADNPKERIVWLNGPAGAGKSSIAQTIAERCHRENKLLSSFFFSRTATTSGRDDGDRLVPTIAYHLAIAIPEAKDLIVAELRRNPAILSYSMEAQMNNLVMDTLEQAIVAHLIMTGISCTPQLVIIDGLDECNGPQVQSMILKVIAGILLQLSVHLRFLIASRPEWEIRKTFDLPTFNGIYNRLTLDESYKPSKDIALYLRSEFTAMTRTHPLRSSLVNWPSQVDLNSLVEGSSGQFIYASTVIKFIADDRGNPRDRLQTILNVSAGGISNKSPYAQLDALYIHILSTAAAAAEHGYMSIYPTLEALIYSEDIYRRDIFTTQTEHCVQKLAAFLDIDCDTLWLSLVDLYSILYVPISNSHDREMHFFHASFKDFLKDPLRSGEFFIPEDKAHVSLGHRCFSILSSHEFKEATTSRALELTPIQLCAKLSYFSHMNKSNFDDELLNELRSQNIKAFMDGIFSGIAQKTKFVMKHLFSYQISTDGTHYCKIVPLSEKLQDMFYCILEAFDDSEWDHCNRFEVYKVIGSFAFKWAPSSLHVALQISTLEDPVRGKRKNLFICDETCRRLLHGMCDDLDIFAKNFLTGILIDIMRFLLGKIEPSYYFGKFLRSELSKIKTKLKLFSYKAPTSGVLSEFNAQGIELEKEIDIYLKKCDALSEESNTPSQ